MRHGKYIYIYIYIYIAGTQRRCSHGDKMTQGGLQGQVNNATLHPSHHTRQAWVGGTGESVVVCVACGGSKAGSLRLARRESAACKPRSG